MIKWYLQQAKICVNIVFECTWAFKLYQELVNAFFRPCHVLKYFIRVERALNILALRLLLLVRFLKPLKCQLLDWKRCHVHLDRNGR